ncbi:hypothetical protein GTW38_14350 [Streptomyces sp. SID7804]|nr:hypothetical protein [Streptomyces sp. SID7804]
MDTGVGTDVGSVGTDADTGVGADVDTGVGTDVDTGGDGDGYQVRQADQW